ncbi:hypothetical protein GY50_0980 [Dehalococcoides mccartyi GY50]|nr:hypothetical protein GY50_0980 [Dehalococcoides mccartyi GY50]
MTHTHFSKFCLSYLNILSHFSRFIPKYQNIHRKCRKTFFTHNNISLPSSIKSHIEQILTGNIQWTFSNFETYYLYLYIDTGNIIRGNNILGIYGMSICDLC